MARRSPFSFLPAASLWFVAAASAEPMQFDWPKDLTCRVEQRISATGAPDFLLRFDLHASEAPDDGRYLEALLPEMRAPGEAGAHEAEPAEAAFLLATKLPPFHIGPAGSLLGLRDAEQAKARVREALIAALPAPPSDENLRQMVEQLARPEVLENQVGNLWNAAVEQWAGKELTAKPLTGEAETTIPGSDAPLKVTVTLERAREQACGRGGKQRQCVELIATEVPEAANLREVMRAILGADGAAEIDRIKSMSLYTRTVTLTEPDTLLPQTVTVTRTIKITRDGDSQPAETVERQSWKFDCE